MSVAFWQRVLAAEASPETVREAVRGALESPDPEAFLLSGGWGTSAERSRAEGADVPAALRAELAGAQVVPHDAFPQTLAKARNAPPALFVHGDAACLARPLVAVVGTRGASAYGLAMAKWFAGALAEAGVTVVSGGAIGIDAAAHEAALEAGGRTVAVLPGGVDVAYPPRHRTLFGRIREQGALVSSYACGSKPGKHRIPGRNRLVATLAQALVLVEVPAESGALITAALAKGAGRALFVVPGPANQPSFRGSHALARLGAVVVDDPALVLRAVGVSRTESAKPPLPSSGPEGKVARALTGHPTTVEALVDRTGLSASDVLMALTMLEIEGVAVRAPEGYALSP